MSEIRLLARREHGDLNCDDAIDMLDVSAFVSALVDPESYFEDYPNCDRTLADLDGNGFVGMSDIGLFVSLLLNQ